MYWTDSEIKKSDLRQSNWMIKQPASNLLKHVLLSWRIQYVYLTVSYGSLSFIIQATQGLLNDSKLQVFGLGVLSLLLSGTIWTHFIIF